MTIIYNKDGYESKIKFHKRYLFFIDTGTMLFLFSDLKPVFAGEDEPTPTATQRTYKLMAYRLGEGDSFKASINKQLTKNSLLLYESKDNCERVNVIFDKIVDKLKTKKENSIIKI